MILLKCKKCGYMREEKGKVFHNHCYRCKTLDSMVIIANNEEEGLTEALEQLKKPIYNEIANYICITRMEENIQELGHEKCWEIIERMG
ncbi:hypothetical protein LCGC14_1315780, partial [marine sediment metagenome]